jgi:uncharacterized protein
MIDMNMFNTDIEEVSTNLLNLYPYALEITITDECNLRCSYCFEGSSCLKDTSLDCVEEVFDAIDVMLGDEWFNANFSGIRIGFWGGEPTLRPDILRQFAERYKDNELIRFHIYTNGYVIDGLMDVFGDCKDKISVQVSYDGERIHDIKRISKHGDKTASEVKGNIYRLHEEGFNVSLKSTVTHDTLDYIQDCWDDIRQMNEDIGSNMLYNITLDYINPVDIDINKIRSAFIGIAKKELKFFGENGYYLLTWFGNTQPIRCAYFKQGMALNTDGGMMYCHGCTYSCSNKEFNFGNIRDDDFLDKIKHNNKYFELPEVPDACKECVATTCCTCNVIKYEHSTKDSFLDRWFDLSCQNSQCDVFREFSKISISLKDILGGR